MIDRFYASFSALNAFYSIYIYIVSNIYKHLIINHLDENLALNNEYCKGLFIYYVIQVGGRGGKPKYDTL